MGGNMRAGSTYAKKQDVKPTVLAKPTFLLYCPRSVNLISVRTNIALSLGPNSDPNFSLLLHTTHHTKKQNKQFWGHQSNAEPTEP
jgi:hypothetical protein